MVDVAAGFGIDQRHAGLAIEMAGEIAELVREDLEDRGIELDAADALGAEIQRGKNVAAAAHADHGDVDVQVGDHLAYQDQLLVVLLTEEHPVGTHDLQQLAHHRQHAGEMARPGATLEFGGQRAGVHGGAQTVRIHGRGGGREHDLDVFAAQQRQIRLVDAHQERDQKRHQKSRHDIDVEQPLPGPCVGDEAADAWSEGRREHRQDTGDESGPGPPRPLKHQKDCRENQRDQSAAEETLQKLAEIARTEYVSPINRLSIYAGLRQWDRVFEELDVASSEHSPWLCMLKVDPRYDPIRSDARMTDLLNRMGLAKN